MAGGSTIKIRRSAVAGKVPTTSDLSLGELAINTFDGKVFLKTSQTVGQNTTTAIVTLEKQLTAGTGVTITDGSINIGQSVSTSVSPTFAGATLNGVTSIIQPTIGTQNSLKVAGYVGSAGSVFAVGVSSTPADGIKLQSLTSDLANPAKLTISGSSILLKAGDKEWSFTDDGNIQLPSGGDIIGYTGSSVLKFPSVKRVTFDNHFIENNFTSVYDIDGTTNKIRTGGPGTLPLSYGYMKTLEVDGIVTFFGPIGHTEVGVANIIPYKSYYIKTVDVISLASDIGADLPFDDGNNYNYIYPSNYPVIFDITISETQGGSTVDLLDFHTEIYEESIMLSTVSPNSYQTQRAPRHFLNYDEDGNDIRGQMVDATFGDTYYDSDSQHIFIYTNSAGDGTPQRFDFTTGLG